MNLRRKSQKIVSSEAPKKDTTSSILPVLKGKNVCVTGTIPGISREHFYTRLRKIYGVSSVQITVTKTTDYLLTGYGVGQTKLTKAKNYNVPIIEARHYL